ncbi:hypothetical protein Gasu2_64420 [Galdieria sulphuraria]|nr:hypothetical protein Gasu2_64420 [Galdieria sulphuraria]
MHLTWYIFRLGNVFYLVFALVVSKPYFIVEHCSSKFDRFDCCFQTLFSQKGVEYMQRLTGGKRLTNLKNCIDKEEHFLKVVG